MIVKQGGGYKFDKIELRKPPPSRFHTHGIFSKIHFLVKKYQNDNINFLNDEQKNRN